MSMTPADVRAQQFRVVFRGYDVEQVDAFLDRVQAALRTQPPTAAPETPAAPPAPPAPAPDSTDGPSRALRVLEAAERAGEQLVASAHRDADDILAIARGEADELRTTSADEGARIRAQARADAAEALAEARTRADDVLAAARDEAARLELEVAQWHRREIDELDARRLSLTAEVERLEAQERTCRDRLQRALQDTLRQVTDGFAAELLPPQMTPQMTPLR